MAQLVWISDPRGVLSSSFWDPGKAGILPTQWGVRHGVGVDILPVGCGSQCGDGDPTSPWVWVTAWE